MNKDRLNGLPPMIDRNSRILILGSFPGPLSLSKREYYAYPRNQFWKMVFDLLGVEGPASYRVRIKILKYSRIGLWDVIGSCRRKDASDSNIYSPVFNDIASLLIHHPGIKAVFCNGNKSYSVYKARYKNIGVPFTYLPSTSPAHAGRSYAHKKKSWRKILKFL